MLTEEKIRFVREKLKEREEVATKELLQGGIDNNDIIRLKKLGIIESSKWGHYKLVDVSKYYDEAIKAVESKEYGKAVEFFEKSINVSFNVMESNYYLFLISVLNNNLDDAFKYFEVLYNKQNDIISKGDLNFYLYMISYYNSVPSEYCKIVRNMKIEDTLDSKKKYMISREVKNQFFNKRFINSRKSIVLSEGFQSRVIYHIISKVIDALNTEKRQLIDLIKEKKYEEVYEYYLDIESYRDLADYETICLDIVEEIVQIFKLGGVLPKSNKVMTNILSVAIGNKDYKRALEINVQFNKSKGINNSTNQINLLLVAINDIIDNIDKVREEIKTNGNEEVETQGLEETQDYSKLVEYLMSGRIEDFITELKNYLTNINKEEYMFLIMNLVKIDSMLEDNMYSRTMMKLSLIVSGEFSFEISEYVMCFYEYLAMKRFEVASIYLDIIESAKERKITSFSVTGFREIFDKKVNDSGKLFSGVTSSLEVRRRYTFEDLNIQYTLEDLKRSKVLMLDANVDNEYIKEVVSELNDVLCFEINIDGEERMMLKYKEVSEEEGVRLSIRMK